MQQTPPSCHLFALPLLPDKAEQSISACRNVDRQGFDSLPKGLNVLLEQVRTMQQGKTSASGCEPLCADSA